LNSCPGTCKRSLFVAVSVSDVINSRLELVITPSSVCSEVVVSPACTLTTTSLLVFVFVF